jgi:hypothetical protein
MGISCILVLRNEVLWFWGICDFGVSALDWLLFEKDKKSILGLLHLGFSIEIFKNEDFGASAAGNF